VASRSPPYGRKLSCTLYGLPVRYLPELLTFAQFLISAGFALIGGFLLFRVVAREWPSARASRNWPAVEGIVTRSRLRGRVVAQRPRVTIRWTLKDQPLVDFAYGYSVSGRRYEGARVVFGDEAVRSTDETRLSQYPVGTRVLVHYDPRSPARSVLETGPTRYLGYQAVVGIVFLVVGVSLAALALPYN
jgi:hypothetical protein